MADVILTRANALLASRKTEDRIKGVSLLRQAEDEQAQPVLLRALHDKASYVATLAAQQLAERATVAALPDMQAHFAYLAEDGLKRDPGCHVRANLAFAFGRLEVQQAIDLLRIGIKTVQIEAVGGVPTDTATQLRAHCALALAHMRAPDALRDIAPLLFDYGNPGFTAHSHADFVTVEVRKAAAQALARLASVDSIVPLAIKLTYPAGETAEVLQECMGAVVDLEDDRALELLSPYLQHHDPQLAAYAGLMLARARVPEALPLLLELLDRLTGDPLHAVLLAISTLRTDEAMDALRELAKSKRAEVSRLAAQLV